MSLQCHVCHRQRSSSSHFVMTKKSCMWKHTRANGCTFMKTEQSTKGKTPQNEKNRFVNTRFKDSYDAIRLISRPDQACVRGVFSAKGTTLIWRRRRVCLSWRRPLQVVVQVEVEREEQAIGKTTGKEQSEEQRVKERTIAQRG